jgi:Spy/CpxP family protein refolding chaperone
MKKQLCLLTVSALFAIGAAMGAPQDPPVSPSPAGNGQGSHHQMDPDRQVKMLTKKLDLTADQQTQIRSILTDRQQQFESIRNDSSLAPKDRHEKMRTLREESENKIKGVLTDSQKQTYDQMQQQMREHMQQRRQERDQTPNAGANPQS